MCLGIPGKVVAWADHTDQLARVDVSGVTRTVNVGLVRDEGLHLGDWVLVHVGFAMAIIDEDEATEALRSLERFEDEFETELEELSRSRIE